MSAMSSLFDRDCPAERLPVSLITGFLGSGKTTLLNRLLQRPEMADSAVIINEFGDIALDHLLVAPVQGETLVLASGCVCCAVRGYLHDTVNRLLIERDRGRIPVFSRILIEASGLADPAPVAQLFLNNPLLGRYLRLDAVIATVAAAGGEAPLSQHWEARKQIAIADRLIVTKSDIAAPTERAALCQLLGGLNPAAAIYDAVHGEIAPELLFGVGIADRPWLRSIENAAAHPHQHHAEIHAVSLIAEAPIDWGRFHDWLGRLRANHGERLLRVKGVLNVAGEDRPIAVHGVQHIFHPPVALSGWPDPDRRSRLVLIVHGLDRGMIETGLGGNFRLDG
jgi:G3E family GTPase